MAPASADIPTFDGAEFSGEKPLSDETLFKMMEMLKIPHENRAHILKEEFARKNTTLWLVVEVRRIDTWTDYIYLTEFDKTFFYVNDGRREGVRQDEELGTFGRRIHSVHAYA